MYVKRCLEFTTIAGYSSGRIINPEEGLLREALKEWKPRFFPLWTDLMEKWCHPYGRYVSQR